MTPAAIAGDKTRFRSISEIKLDSGRQTRERIALQNRGDGISLTRRVGHLVLEFPNARQAKANGNAAAAAYLASEREKKVGSSR